MSDYQPQPGDLGLTQIQGRVGWWIKVGQWANGTGFNDYEHAFTVVGLVDGFAGTRIVEAEPGGALNSPLSRYDDADVAYLRCPPEYRDEVAAAALGLVNTPYSFLDYVSLAARRLRVPAPHLRAYVESSRHMICSQLADAAAFRGGWRLFDDGRWPGDVTPGDIYQLYLRQVFESGVS